MSLKAFHIFFITVSILLLFGFAFWEFREFGDGGDTRALLLGILSLGAAMGLIVYEIRVFRKFRDARFT